ncbi:MAG: uroporphyrinogen decarboxylase family protein [Promethearchaeota archaeon]
MNKDGFFSTVVGSLPLENTNSNMVKGFEDIINLGIDYPCYPQLESMITSFLDPLTELIPSLKKVGNNYHLNEDFTIPRVPIALKYGQFIAKFFNERPDLRDKVKGTKACLTGPFTLASAIIISMELASGIKPLLYKEPRAIIVPELVDKLAEIMKRTGDAYSKMGIEIISMDEPMLSLFVGKKLIFHEEDFIIKTLNKAVSGIKNLSSIHVCGRISPLLKELLLRTDIKILDHEFRTEESNFNVYSKKDFDETDKYIGMGVLKTKIIKNTGNRLEDYTENISFLKEYISRGIKQFGKENLIIKPDCGFGPLKEIFGQALGYKIAIRKLKNMVSTLKSFM